MPNEASIDLIANPTKLNAGLATAGTNVDKFGQRAQSSLQKVDKASKQVTTDFVGLATTSVKTAASIASFAFSFTKFATQIWLAEAAVEGLTLALDSSGHSFSVIDKGLEGSQKLLNETAGDVDKLSMRLEEMGLTAEEAGIKIETNLTRVQDAFGKFYKEAIGKGAEEAGIKVTGVFDRISASISAGHERDMKVVTEFFTTVADESTKATKQLKNDIVEWYIADADGGGARVEEHRRTQQKIEDIEKANKVREIQEKMYAEQLTAFRNHAQSITQAELELQDIKAHTAQTTVKQVEKEIEAYQTETQALIKAGRVNEDILARRFKIVDAMIAKQKELQESNAEWQKMTMSVGDTLSEQTKQFEKQREEIALAATSSGALKSYLEDQKDILSELLAENVKSQHQADLIAESTQKVLHLKEMILAATEKEAAVERQADENRSRREKQIADAKRDAGRDVEGAQFDALHEKQMRDLELQGASYRKLHDLKMKFIDQEERRQIRHMEVSGDPIESEKIKAAAAQQRIKQIADFERQAADESRAIARVRADEAEKKEYEELLKKKASEKELHEFTLRSIQREAELEKMQFHTESEHLKLRYDLERKIREEKERFLDLKKAGVDVEAKADGSAPKPKNRKERNAEVKAAIKAKKDAKPALEKKLKDAKDAKATEAQNKKNEARKAVLARHVARGTLVGDRNSKQVQDNRANANEFLQGFKDTKIGAEALAVAKKEMQLVGFTAQASTSMDRTITIMSNVLTKMGKYFP